ncbi:TetR family transcriptional regulator [Amycolatopsis suaedae]|uniref:TetR family transcriptional regulator n=1 Tax=Amycolatopsis suaedae TaxID=2510978 RepID=A0A4V2EL37_9PSEU|nr:TetR family transcriptional regulator [Amycolatopsis suaedae]RZQ60205.1 TetR family transcriptional regulator [Amycolatopsis suaedae]
MANSRDDVLSTALGILRRYGLADLSMRRVAAELDVQPSALYWHFANKQALLTALADLVLAGVTPRSSRTRWDRQLERLAGDLRAALLAVTDGAELVSAGQAGGLSTAAIGGYLVEAARRGGLSERDAGAVRTAIWQLVIGLTIEQQTRAQMERLGAAGPSGRDFDREFADGLALVLDGARHRAQLRTD